MECFDKVEYILSLIGDAGDANAANGLTLWLECDELNTWMGDALKAVEHGCPWRMHFGEYLLERCWHGMQHRTIGLSKLPCQRVHFRYRHIPILQQMVSPENRMDAC